HHPTSTLFPYTTLFRSHIVLPLEFSSGLQHIRFHTDGHLYIVGLTNWASSGHGGEVGSFHRVRYTGEPLRLPVDVRTWANGLERSEEHTSELQSRENIV